jgi:hypothetical protein
MDCVRCAAVTATIGQHIWVCRCIAREYAFWDNGSQLLPPWISMHRCALHRRIRSFDGFHRRAYRTGE